MGTFNGYGGMIQKAKITPFAAALGYFLQRRHNNLTQKKVAEKIGVGQSYISQLKDGYFEGKEERRRKIAALFGYDGSQAGKTYDDFLQLGHSIMFVEQSKRPDREAIHSSVEMKWEKELLPEETENSPPTSHMQNNNVIDLAHQDIIRKFKNKKLACEINEMIVEIEASDPEMLFEIKGYLKALRNESRKRKQKKIPGNGV